MVTSEPGRWYLTFTCKNRKCQRDIAYQEAPEPMVQISGNIDIRCPFCGVPAMYHPSEARRSKGR
jgi:hypothetical protein